MFWLARSKNLLFASLFVSAPLAVAQELILLQNSDGYSTVSSAQWGGSSPQDLEWADDFTFVGDITRVIVHGDKYFNASGTLPIAGVWVRFYEAVNNAPGDMQYELFLPEGAVSFLHAPWPSNLDVVLPLRFTASGQHFVSVQLVTDDPHYWAWWSSHTQSPVGARAHVKDDLGSGDWEVYRTVLGFESDLAFELWGDDGTPLPEPEDPCGAWEDLNTPALPVNYGTTILRDLAVVANDDVWAVGDPSVEVAFLDYEYKNYVLHWDGSAWTEIPVPNPGVMPSPYQATGLQAIDASGPADVWAVGNWERQDSLGFVIDQPLVLRWNGAQFQQLIVPNTNSDTYTYGVKVLAPDDAWLVGGGYEPLAIHWDGSSFEETPVPMPGVGGTPGFDLVDVDGVASDDVWAVGGGSDGDFSGTTYIVHWDGSAWEIVPGPAPGFARRLFDIHARASDDVWAVGQYEKIVGGAVQYYGWVIHWDGSSWELFDGAVEPVGSLSVHAFAPDDVYAGGSQIYHFDGTSWEIADDLGQLTGENIFVSVSGLDAVEPCQLYASGRQDVVGQLVPFTARQQGPSVWATTLASCAAAPGLADGIRLVTGPKLGRSFRVAIGDSNGISGFRPEATQTYWMLSSAELPGPCGFPFPRTGLGGVPAALFIDVSQLVATTGPIPWRGLTLPALHAVPVPNQLALHGESVYTQGLLVDFAQPAPLLLTNELEAVVGN